MPKAIMVVDDRDRYESYRSALSSSLYTVVQTSNTPKALEMAKNSPPDLLITALYPPNHVLIQIGGYELIRRMHARHQDMKFVLLHDHPKSEVQPVLDKLRGEGIVEVKHMGFAEAPNNLGALVQSLLRE